MLGMIKKARLIKKSNKSLQVNNQALLKKTNLFLKSKSKKDKT
jgi:hypothetical protein